MNLNSLGNRNIIFKVFKFCNEFDFYLITKLLLLVKTTREKENSDENKNNRR